jgi:threonyl-tRNA synthetase
MDMNATIEPPPVTRHEFEIPVVFKYRIIPDDFEKIEAEMRSIAKANQEFERKVISRSEAKTLAESGRLGGLTEPPGSPSRFKLDLYRTSGHFPYYQESQFPAIAERDTLEKLTDESASCDTLVNGLSDGSYEGYLLKFCNRYGLVCVSTNEGSLPGPISESQWPARGRTQPGKMKP